MSSVLGVDGGQSGIRVRHSASHQTVEVAGVSRQQGDPIAAVAAAVNAASNRAPFPPVDVVVLGLTTAPVNDRDADRLAMLVSASTGAGEVLIADDAVTGHAGALSGCPGLSVVAGTGVASLVLPENGDARVIGGHGFLLGDEGGGFWIGAAGLKAVLRAREGRSPATDLTDWAERRFGDLTGLHVRLHDEDRPVNAIAQFAPDVLVAADAGDPVAAALVDQAATELFTLVRVGAAWADNPPVPVALGGRLLAAGTPLRHRLDARIRDSGLSVVVRTAEGSALDGALLLGAPDGARRYGPLVHRWARASTP